ncbi:alpha-L-rhamnosidase-related protein [Parapedobacter koreensis]|uniref:Alpha-L-rhamnosidase six-hairpin glycosidase domain-containing protein n=1 Tax=Parapedobacter koreensis TaxID=332977 RepID=A0A1H7RTM5_9SPHI|nr:hypothetical protein [Parapedobacter koreensis]SEL63369.1 hypothetical protein SAMN05421740_107289 [Parapedobacter koreensis]
MKAFGILLTAMLLLATWRANGQIHHDPMMKAIHIITADKRLALHIDYSQGCKVAALEINHNNTLAPTGLFTAAQTADASWASWGQDQQIKVSLHADEVTLAGIMLGDIAETWRFRLEGDKLSWTIDRAYPADLMMEDMAMPTWHFADLNTWKGGILDNGGMVWCKYLSAPNDTYGVHTGGVTFWNEDEADGLRITVRADENQSIAAKYSQNEQGAFTCTHLVTDTELGQRHHLSRFVHQKADVFAPFEVKAGNVAVTYELAYINYLETYDRGALPGIDAAAVRELLNTTGRYGVVDNRIVGANGWITNWKCLHEPFFAQIGLALNDSNYTDNLSATLDQERDLAMREDGRVLSRWHDVPGDEIPGTYNSETGYYEAMWGYTVDSQTGYVINAAEQFQQTADVDWLRSHKASCERALDWLIRRDTNGNGIFEMVNQHVAEQKASDWVDIVWAGFENAFVNAQLYEALNHWVECEHVLGDQEKAAYYRAVADRLKAAFNKTVDEGGFWSPEKKQYVYWRDDDGTVHGDNLVTPVNFAAIAFGLCDDKQRVATILEHIERRTEQEGLFHWPLCFDSFKREEVHANNWPFPRYENGDIFPTWGYLGIRSYVKYDRDLALKYIRNLLAQYRKDGLSSQRYSRVDQKGLGSDILAGISTTVTALYSDIYGVRPKWNRMGVEPNMVPELNGTQFTYTLHDTAYELSLSVNDYQLRTQEFSVRSNRAFGVGRSGTDVVYYPENEETMRLVVRAGQGDFTDLQITQWDAGHYQWSVTGNGQQRVTVHGLTPNAEYAMVVNGKHRKATVAPDGSLTAEGDGTGAATFALRLR